jgi:hypothetical protein
MLPCLPAFQETDRRIALGKGAGSLFYIQS